MGPLTLSLRIRRSQVRVLPSALLISLQTGGFFLPLLVVSTGVFVVSVPDERDHTFDCRCHLPNEPLKSISSRSPSNSSCIHLTLFIRRLEGTTSCCRLAF